MSVTTSAYPPSGGARGRSEQLQAASDSGQLDVIPAPGFPTASLQNEELLSVRRAVHVPYAAAVCSVSEPGRHAPRRLVADQIARHCAISAEPCKGQVDRRMSHLRADASSMVPPAERNEASLLREALDEVLKKYSDEVSLDAR